MNFWQLFGERWGEKELKKWTSFKKTTYLLLPLLVYFVVHDIAEIFLWGVMELALTGGSDALMSFCTNNAYTLRGIINGFAIMIGVAVIWKPVKNEICVNDLSRERALARGRGNDRTSVNVAQVTSWCFLAAFSFCVSVGINMLFSLTGFSESTGGYDTIREMQYGVQFLVGLILYGMISPFAEEAVFRGLLYNRMKRCFHYPIALVVSSVLFGVYHGNLVQAVYGTVIGILIAYMYEKYKSFAAPVLFHAVANISIFALTYNDKTGSMKKETGIGTMAVTLAGAAICFWQINKKMKPE